MVLPVVTVYPAAPTASSAISYYLSASVGHCASQSGLISTTVNLLVQVVLTFSQNLSRYVVLNYYKFSDLSMREFAKDENIFHSILSRWLADREDILKRALEGCTSEILSTFDTWSLKIQIWSLFSEILVLVVLNFSKF